MLRASFPDLAASAAAAPFAAMTVGSLRKKTRKATTKSALSSLRPLSRSLASAARSSSSSSTSATRLAALSSRDSPPSPIPDFRPDSLTGRWHKLKAESDDMRAACDAVELNRVLRMGVGLVNTLDIVDQRGGGGGGGSGSGGGGGVGGNGGKEAYFATTLKAGGILDVRERYPWSGAQVEHSRRDKRRGKHSGWVSLVVVAEEDGEEGGEEGQGEKAPAKRRLHPRISVTWPDPHGGECTDTFVLSRSGRKMTQLSVLAVRGKEVVTYKTVFTR